MKRFFLLVGALLIGAVTFSYASNTFTYENAKELAENYIAGSLGDENWTKDTHPKIVGKGKSFFTDTDSPSYIEFKVICDKNPDCGFILVNVDGDDVSIPMASTNGITPSELLLTKNIGSADKNKFYYFDLFDQFAENKDTGDVVSIAPQDDVDITIAQDNSLNTEKAKADKKQELKGKLKEKLQEFRVATSEYKKSDDFKNKRNKIRELNQTVIKEGEKFSYQGLPLFNQAFAQTGGYVPPTYASNTFVSGSSYMNCNGKLPCYDQFTTTYNGVSCASGCVPTAYAIIFGYYDRAGTYPNLITGTAPTLMNSDIQTLEHTLGVNMGTVCSGSGGLGGTSQRDGVAGAVQYARAQGYSTATGSATASAVFLNFKTEIAAGRPAVLGNGGHAMTGFGYYSTTNTGTQIVRVNLGWGPGNQQWTSTGVGYYGSNIDYNMNSLYYNNATQSGITTLGRIKIVP